MSGWAALQRWRVALLIVPSALVAAALALAPPIPQPEAYHDFADQRTLLGLPHFWNVVSNLPLLAVGLAGLAWTARHRGDPGAFARAADAWPYLAFFAAVALVGLGSGYYHLDPHHVSLYFDRLPMALAFMALFAALIAERLWRRLGLLLLPALLVAGATAASYWLWSELAGQGDLRPYLLVQAVPLVMGPVLVGLFRGGYSRGRDFIGAGACYLLALLCDALDAPLYALTGEQVSGHTLKHLLAAAAAYWILHMLQRRRPRDKETPPASERG